MESALEAIIVDFDADSALPGSSGNNSFWAENCPVPVALALDREWGLYAPGAISLKVRELSSRSKCPILLGGGHSLTYHVVREICHIEGAVNVLHYDAHHDAYGENRLSHYTVMNRLQVDLPVSVTSVGVRYQPGDAVIQRPPHDGAPWYVSIDVDFFSSSVFASVMHAVPGNEHSSIESLLADIQSRLENNRVIGCDLVEWISPRASADERVRAATLLAGVVEVVTAKCS